MSREGPTEDLGAPTSGEGGVLASEALEGHVCVEARRGAALRLVQWETRDPDLACGITVAAAGTFGVSGATAEELLDAYGELAADLGFRRISVPLQVHRSQIVRTGGGTEPGWGEGFHLTIAGRVDGQITTARGCLLGSTAADCVPVYLWGRASGALGLAHAGWRGVAAGILPRAVERMRRIQGTDGELRVHLGPAICGRCYEVDRPVREALRTEGDRAHVDLRGLLVLQARSSGVSDECITVSGHCTCCGPEGLHSHRSSGGRAGRMLAFLGLRAAESASPG